MKQKLVILVLFLTTLNACTNVKSVNGKGPVITQTENHIGNFSGVVVSKGLRVVLAKGNKNEVTIKVNENLMELIEVFVKEDKLYITSEYPIRKATSKEIRVTYKNIKEVVVHSGSRITNTGVLKNKDLKVVAHSGASANLNLRSDILTCKVHSGSKLVVSGFTNSSIMESHSGATLNALDLKSKKTTASSHSGATLKVFSSHSLNAHAHSGASIRFAGNPEHVVRKKHSGGSITSL